MACPLVLTTCRALKDSLTDNEGKGHIKVVVDAKSDRVLGIHLVGPEVAEILQVCRRACILDCLTGVQLMHLLEICATSCLLL